MKKIFILREELKEYLEYTKNKKDLRAKSETFKEKINFIEKVLKKYY